MGKIAQYEKAILELLKEYDYPPSSTDKVTTHLIVDSKKHHYQVLTEGWVEDDDFMLNISLYLHIRENGKIWILENRTEDDIAQLLANKGVSKSDIVLGLLPPQVRSYSGYATA